MYSACWVAISFAVLLSLVDAASIATTETMPRVDIKEHRSRVQHFRCSVPQERSYKITKLLLPGSIAPTDEVYPPYTVIRTCDEGTGCCDSEEKVCAPISFEYEEVEIRVSDLVNGTKLMKKLKIEHHKECRCKLRSGVSNHSMPVNVTFTN